MSSIVPPMGTRRTWTTRPRWIFRTFLQVFWWLNCEAEDWEISLHFILNFEQFSFKRMFEHSTNLRPTLKILCYQRWRAVQNKLDLNYIVYLRILKGTSRHPYISVTRLSLKFRFTLEKIVTKKQSLSPFLRRFWFQSNIWKHLHIVKYVLSGCLERTIQFVYEPS